MARMIPSHVDPDLLPPGESMVFSQLASAPGTDEWVVLHSFDLPNHVEQVEGEIDFVVVVPGLGVLCLEVKSHTRVARDDRGIWHLGQDPPTARGPFKQASTAMHSLVQAVKRSHHGLSGVPFISAVCTPRCSFDVPATEWHAWQVIDDRAIARRPLEQCIRSTLANARSHYEATPTAGWFRPEDAEPTPAQVEQIVATLRGSFEVHQSPKARQRERREQLRRYTEEQFGALDLCEANHQCSITGPAGTGKTLLAIEQARRFSHTHDAVLVVCYNRLLGTWFKAELDSDMPRIASGTIHSLMVGIADEPVPSGAGREFWDHDLPSMTIDALLNGHELLGAFDAVVVDEAQDILFPPYLDVLDLLTAKGLGGTRLALFGDLQKQAIYRTEAPSPQQCIGERFTPIASLPLKDNCRNTPRIGTYVSQLSGTPHLYRSYRRPDDGVNPTTAFWTKDSDQLDLLEHHLDRLLQEGYRSSDIVVLSATSSSPIAAALPQPWSHRLRPIGSWDQPHGGYTTIASFKGLEAPAIVVTDITQVKTDRHEALLYVALSRATDRLVLLAQESSRDDIWDLFSRL